MSTDSAKYTSTINIIIVLGCIRFPTFLCINERLMNRFSGVADADWSDFNEP